MAKLVTGLQTAVADPAFKERLANLGAAPVPPSQANPESLRAYVKSEIDKWAAIIKEADIYAE
jgi:tripartite-type tricarboxylate transporter receptor subunit TctC